MGSNENYRIAQWRPPQRPDWVARVNEEGACLDLRHVAPLGADSLIRCAQSNTGLSDFGADDWQEPFRLLVRSYDEEAELNLMGRLMTRSDLLTHLEARLRVEDCYRRHPEIEAQEISAPILIVGAGRCGTSAMQNLLAQDPENGTPKHWEALFPVPPPEASSYHTDPRIAIGDQRMTQWNRVTPEIMAMHEFGGEMPTELIQLETLSFQSIAWLSLYGFCPSYMQYMAQRSPLPALRYAKRVLKLLQWKNPRKRTILKSPATLAHLPEALEVFPELRVVWMHRDPIKALSSVVNLVGTLFWIRSDRRFDANALANITNPSRMAAQYDQAIDWLEQGVVPSTRMCSVQYGKFISDPIAEVERLYNYFDMELSDPARETMTAYLGKHPRESRPAHRYSTGDPSHRTEERKLFDRYQKYFNVEEEC